MRALAIYSPHDRDAIAIGKLYQRAKQSMVESMQYLIEAGDRLAKKKDSMPHGKWLPWLEANAGILGFDNAATAQRLMKLSKSKSRVDAVFGETEALELSRTIWGNVPARGTAGTGDNEWFTPAEYIDLARDVLGTIDLDPATHIKAQKLIKAGDYFTKQDDALACEWHGRVWLNPPYAQPLIAQFASKMVAEYRAGRVTAAIVLTHNYTDTAWFHELASAAKLICFKRGRVQFYEPGGDIAAPTQGQAFFYFGSDGAAFTESFKPIGLVMCPCG